MSGVLHPKLSTHTAYGTASEDAEYGLDIERESRAAARPANDNNDNNDGDARDAGERDDDSETDDAKVITWSRERRPRIQH